MPVDQQPHSGYRPKELKVKAQTEVRTLTLTAAVCTTAETWEQPKPPPTDNGQARCGPSHTGMPLSFRRKFWPLPQPGRPEHGAIPPTGGPQRSQTHGDRKWRVGAGAGGGEGSPRFLRTVSVWGGERVLGMDGGGVAPQGWTECC